MDALLTKAAEEVIVREHLERALKAGKKLRIKFGIDPTTPELHLGHVVPLLKLRAFQEAGHKIVLIIGDFTAMIGDPSGRSETRKPLTEADVKKNFKTYEKQAGKILDIKKTEIRRNSEWYGKGGAGLLLELASKVSAQQLLEREDFQRRMKEGEFVAASEELYPLLQGYDSVMVKSDVEVGGNDQKFNLLMGRRLQRLYGQSEQNVMMLTLLLGTDGIRKMSKSFGNHIPLEASPYDMFGKVMSIPDEHISHYAELLLAEPPLEALTPYEAKQALARGIVTRFCSAREAEKAESRFIDTFSKRQIPDDIPTIGIEEEEIALLDLLLLSGIKSKSEARRLVAQHAVDIDGRTATDVEETITAQKPITLKVGKRKFFRVVRL